jgi:hypothetical protein
LPNTVHFKFIGSSNLAAQGFQQDQELLSVADEFLEERP